MQSSKILELEFSPSYMDHNEGTPILVWVGLFLSEYGLGFMSKEFGERFVI